MTILIKSIPGRWQSIWPSNIWYLETADVASISSVDSMVMFTYGQTGMEYTFLVISFISFGQFFYN
jgi:hypothetical protein